MNKITSILFFICLTLSCSEVKQNNGLKPDQKNSDKEYPDNIKGQIATFLTFQKEDAE